MPHTQVSAVIPLVKCASEASDDFAAPRDVEEIYAVKVGQIQGLCRTSLSRDEAWCVLYCGGVRVIRNALLEAPVRSNFHYNEESFDW